MYWYPELEIICTSATPSSPDSTRVTRVTTATTEVSRIRLCVNLGGKKCALVRIWEMSRCQVNWAQLEMSKIVWKITNVSYYIPRVSKKGNMGSQSMCRN